MGRNSKLPEIFLEFNLGPTHMLESIVEEVYDIMKKEYLHSKDSKGKLVTSVSCLVDPNHGSAIMNFRTIEEKSKLPLAFWN